MAHYDCDCCGKSFGITHDHCSDCQARKCRRVGGVPGWTTILPTPTTQAEDARDTHRAQKLTGLSVDYYKVRISNPTSDSDAYTVECNDIIEALGMNFAEGNALKAIWRHAALRQGRGKPGSSLLYDAEKVVFFGQRMVAQDKYGSPTSASA